MLVLLIPAGAWAEESTETVYYDYSNDQASYGMQVAELIGQGQTDSAGKPGEGKRGQAEPLFTVLCRSEEGFKPDFKKLNPAYVVAGPQSRYLRWCSCGGR